MTKRLGGRSVSDIGLGTWGMGGWQTADKTNDSTCVDAIRYAVSRGINVIDTAEMYGAGHTEEIVAKAIEGVPREDVFIISKVWKTNLHLDSLIKSARASLRRLKTPYLDLYLIHWPNPSVPVSETIGAMEELLKQGLVRSIGVSNFDIEQLSDAMSASKYTDIAANQILYNYGTRGPEKDIIPFCEKNGVDVISYTPILKGKVSEFSGLNKIAEKYNATAVQVALRYTMERSLPIPKSSSKSHIDMLIEGSRMELRKDDYEFLKSCLG